MNGSTVVNGSQQQFLVRNSNLDGWSNGVWNQVFSGDNGAPATCFPASSACGGPYTTLPTSPVTVEPPFLTVGSGGSFGVSVPSLLNNLSVRAGMVPTSATRCRSRTPGGYAGHAGGAGQSGACSGKNLIFTPGVYDSAADRGHQAEHNRSASASRRSSSSGEPALVATPNNGVKITGLIIDAYPVTSPTSSRWGPQARPAMRPITPTSCLTCSSASAAPPRAAPRSVLSTTPATRS
jgi:hypothetical protein